MHHRGLKDHYRVMMVTDLRALMTYDVSLLIKILSSRRGNILEENVSVLDFCMLQDNFVMV